VKSEKLFTQHYFIIRFSLFIIHYIIMEHHDHDHHGHHHHHVPDLKRINQAFYVGIGANALYTIIEFVVGIRINSLALISDASHNLSDVATLIISLLGMKLAQKGATTLYTYGYKKASILASFVNAVILCLIVIKIGVESIERFSHPPQMQGVMIIITALIGIFINGLSAFLFYKGQKDDINIKGAPGSAVRSVFMGEVSGVFMAGGVSVVMIRHGIYITVYANLGSVSVGRGQKVGTGQTIGTVGKGGILQFQLRKETAKLNPEQWLR